MLRFRKGAVSGLASLNWHFGEIDERGRQAIPLGPGYSANFFDDDHYVMKGGFPRTAAKLLRRSFRNWFRKGYQYVYAAFRVVSARVP